MEAAADLGYKFEKLSKFIDPQKCVPNCSACMLGCKKGAKWTARGFVEEARTNGATMVTGTTITEAIVKKGKVEGVRGFDSAGPVEFSARVVVIAAGGLGTPLILQRSEIEEAGQGFFCDFFTFTCGFNREISTKTDMPMSVVDYEFYESEGFILSPVVDPRGLFPLSLWKTGAHHLPKALKYGKIMGIMTKIRDSLDGRVNADGTFSKRISYDDRRKLDRGAIVSERILIKAGCDPRSIVSTAPRGAHPGGTNRIGQVLDENLETKVKNLYACDASVVPDSLGTPVILTCVALGKRLARRLADLL
jgi:choline dehydrogenase-like flavoprotein